MREAKGCFGIVPKVHLIDQIKFSTCPGNFTSPSVSFLLAQFFRFEAGMLPYNGSLGDQPAKIVEIFNVIRHIQNEQKEAQSRGRQSTNSSRVRR